MVKQVQIVVWDDLDHYHQGIDTPGAETYTFGWAGRDWEIDLTEDHYKEMHEALRPWLEVARPAERQEKPAASHHRRGYRNPETGKIDWPARKQRTKDLAKVRNWATEKGIALPARGNLPVELQREWNASHPDDQIRVISSGGPVDE